ncbi:hypothetical protein ACRAVF_30895 [Bradyrhizobium oligotrophicum S58]
MKHIFWKNETQIFLTGGLDRQISLKALAKFAAWPIVAEFRTSAWG